MAINGSSGAKHVAVTAPDGGALDVHAHAMPLPLLERLAERGLADLAGCPTGSSGSTRGSAGSARSHRCRWPGRSTTSTCGSSEMDEVGVRPARGVPAALPVLLHRRRRGVRHRHRRRGQRRARHLRRGRPRPADRRWARCRWAGAAPPRRPALPGRPRDGRHRDRQPRRRAATSTTRSTTTCGRCCPSASTFVFLHPSGVPDPHRQADFWLPQLVGYPMETALAVARLVFGRVLERHPLNLCLAHGGGCLPALRGRLDMGWDRKDVAHTTTVPPRRSPTGSTTTPPCSPASLLRRLVEDVGVDTCCWAPTTPSSSATGTPLDTVRALGLDPGRHPRDPGRQRREPARPVGEPVARLSIFLTWLAHRSRLIGPLAHRPKSARSTSWTGTS